MKSPQGPWFMLEETGSTQDVAASLLDAPDPPSVVYAAHQTNGRGRFKRPWVSKKGDSLTFSLLLHDYRGHREPWLLGMACAIAVARSLDGNVQWPNDVLLGGKKVAGILIEMLPFDAPVKVPVVGIGVNLNQTSFPPELDHKATSVFLQTEVRSDPIKVGEQILSELERLPEPVTWGAIEPQWRALDATPGKRYRLHSGEHATALRVGETGELVCRAQGDERRVMAADAVFGHEV